MHYKEHNNPFLPLTTMSTLALEPELTSREYVDSHLTDPEYITEIFNYAGKRACPETHCPVAVHYMGPGVWEIGLVPKKVDFKDNKVSTQEMLLFRADSDTVRGPDECVLINGVWERYPD